MGHRGAKSVAVAVAVLAVTVAATAKSAGDLVRVSGASPYAGCASGTAFTNTEVEPSLASDPGRPQRLVAVYQQDRYQAGGGARGLGLAISEDGGRTWRRQRVPITACAEAAQQATFASDPWASIGPDHRIYVAGLTTSVNVMTSVDHGASWSKPISLRGPGLTDKPALTADPTRPGTAYVVWSDYRDTDPPGTESDELFSVTHDGGKTWSRPQALIRHGTHAGPEDGQIVVDPRNGRLYAFMAWVRGGSAAPSRPVWLQMTRSDDDGGHWTNVRRFAVGNPARAPRGPDIRSSPAVPSFAIDRTGALYAVWQDARFNAGSREGIAFTKSTDGGEHWMRVRDAVHTGGRALMPAIAATGRGRIAILYLQLGATGIGSYRMLTSRDGAARLADHAVGSRFDVKNAPLLTASPLVPGGYFVGDYVGLAPAAATRWGALVVTTSPNAGNKTDVYYTTVAR